MSLPEIFKNKININDDNKYFRGSAKNIDTCDCTLPFKAKIKYHNKTFNVNVINMTDNYYITSNRNVLYKKDVKILEKE